MTILIKELYNEIRVTVVQQGVVYFVYNSITSNVLFVFRRPYNSSIRNVSSLEYLAGMLAVCRVLGRYVSCSGQVSLTATVTCNQYYLLSCGADGAR